MQPKITLKIVDAFTVTVKVPARSKAAIELARLIDQHQLYSDWTKEMAFVPSEEDYGTED